MLGRKASICAFIVHEFHSQGLKQKYLTPNAADLQGFVHAIAGWQNEVIGPGNLLCRITLPGAGRVPSDMPIAIGKVRTNLAVAE